MRILLMAFLLVFMPAKAAQPALGKNEAATLIDQGLAAEPLIWLPFPLPYTVDQTDKNKDGLLLDALFRHGLIEREKDMRMVEVTEAGFTRRKVQLRWVYNYSQERREQGTPEGFYYGKGKLKKVVELSAPYLIGDYYYAEAYVQWYVTDIQDWIADPAFRSARTLRRTLESYEKPFEKRLYLQFDGGSWALWKGEPGML
ncbi:hypothetical protein ACQUQU_03800 [Thalassolituus sp. LLYu03]|uniref:hypothetical protein n=1 Tax=Thalassolituus sp. LLYu03 TaxID=3421656 RepID=UPI003D2BDEF9